MWEEGTVAPLPTTITYTTEAELRELEKLRMEVALLQQESCLEQVKVSPSTCSNSTLSDALCKQQPLLPLFLQALSDLLTPQLSSIISGCPSVSVLRDVYSLLGEGGLRFPAIVVDTDPDC